MQQAAKTEHNHHIFCQALQGNKIPETIESETESIQMRLNFDRSNLLNARGSSGPQYRAPSSQFRSSESNQVIGPQMTRSNPVSNEQHGAGLHSTGQNGSNFLPSSVRSRAFLSKSKPEIG